MTDKKKKKNLDLSPDSSPNSSSGSSDESSPKKKPKKKKSSSSSADECSELQRKLDKSKQKLDLKNVEIESLKQKLKSLQKELDEALQTIQEYKSKASEKKEEKKTASKSSKKKKRGAKYDIVLNIDSIIAANTKGWEIEFKDLKKIVEKFKLDQIALGMIGRENVGKTHIINKISGESFASGYYTNTKGLSIKYCGEKKGEQLKVLLDSAGMNSAILFYNREEVRRYLEGEKSKLSKEDMEKTKALMINDRSMTEVFIQNFVLFSCNIIVIVVELLSQNDQKIIERIKYLYHGRKKIIIIHNLFKLENKEDAINRAEMEIKGSFLVTEAVIPGTEVPYYIEKLDNNKANNIPHLILGKEGSESGDFFNDATFEFFTKNIETDIAITKFDLLERINTYWNEKKRLYVSSDTSSFEKAEKKSEKAPKECFEQIEGDKKLLYKLNTPGKLELRVPEFNVLGALKEIDLNYYMFRSSDKTEKIYYFELPGCSQRPEISLKRIQKEGQQVLTMKIANSYDFPKDFKCVEGEVKGDVYEKKIKITDEFGDYTCDKDFTKLENGILKLKFILKGDEEL